MPKKLKGNPLGFFNIHSVAKLQKIEGGTLGNFFRKKSRNVEKKLKGGPFSLVRYCMIRGKKENLFGSVTWTNRYNLGFCRTFGRTVLVTSGVSKKNADEKP